MKFKIHWNVSDLYTWLLLYFIYQLDSFAKYWRLKYSIIKSFVGSVLLGNLIFTVYALGNVTAVFAANRPYCNSDGMRNCAPFHQAQYLRRWSPWQRLNSICTNHIWILISIQINTSIRLTIIVNLSHVSDTYHKLYMIHFDWCVKNFILTYHVVLITFCTTSIRAPVHAMIQSLHLCLSVGLVDDYMKLEGSSTDELSDLNMYHPESLFTNSDWFRLSHVWVIISIFCNW